MVKSKKQSASEKEAIDDELNAESYSAEEVSRDAWVGVLIPAVGSAAFFASMMVNVIRTYSRYGWPAKAFKTTDYVLMAIPFAIVGLALYEALEKAKKDNGGQVEPKGS
jgi:mannose/fructose/N-acetylgalactosamine-specific phosphotransferase system component IIC